jgi:hypothetical protein
MYEYNTTGDCGFARSHSAKPLPSVALGKGPSVNFSMVKALWALGKDGTRQRKVGRDGASLLMIHLPSAGPVGTRQKNIFFEKLCRVPRSQALGKFF